MYYDAPYGDEIPEVPQRYIDQYNEDLECECDNAVKDCPHTFDNLSEEEQSKLVYQWWEDLGNEDNERDAYQN